MEFVIPPGLERKVENLHFLYQVQKEERKPIMVAGPSGVGKSLFLKVIENLYLKDNPGGNVVMADCSHFSGDIARSELFGHIKGAFTGATQNKQGLVAEAANGLLILEEIGTLPKEIQAMLLTFIETKKYRKVGNVKLETVKNVWIVAATNDEKALREDIKHRFTTLNVPPLCQRRSDILHCLAYKYPEYIPRLRPIEILALCCYNWPGNFREIEKVGTIFKMNELRSTGNKSMFAGVRSGISDFSPYQVLQIERTLHDKIGIGHKTIEWLDALFYKFGLGIWAQIDRDKRPDPFRTFSSLELIDMPGIGIKKMETYLPFIRAAVDGVNFFCNVFLLDPNGITDLLDIENSVPNKNNIYTDAPFFYENDKSYKEYPDEGMKDNILNTLENREKLERVKKKIHKYYYPDRDKINYPAVSVEVSINKDLIAASGGVSTPELAIKESGVTFGPKLPTFKDLQRQYIQETLDRSGGNMKLAAELAGRNYRTFQSWNRKINRIK